MKYHSSAWIVVWLVSVCHRTRNGFSSKDLQLTPLEGYRAVRLRAAELATAKAQRAAPLRGARPAPEGIGALPLAPRAAQVATHGFAPQSQLVTYLVEAATQLTIAVQSDHAKLGPTYRTLDTARILTNSATHTALRFAGPVNNPGCHSPALTWPRRDTRVVSAPADGDGLRAAYLVFWAGLACDVLPGGWRLPLA